MLQPNPEFPPEYPSAFTHPYLAQVLQEYPYHAPAYGASDSFHLTIETTPLHLLPEKTRFRTHVKRLMASLAIVGSLGYAADVGKNVDDERRAKPNISVILEAKDPQNADHAIIVENGFNTKDADDLSTSIGPAIQKLTDGEVWSVQSNNAIATSDSVYEKAVELAKTRGIKSITIATYSMGDMRGVEVAERFATLSDIPVPCVVIISGPAGYDGLREHQKNEMWWAKTLSQLIFGSAYSTLFRYGAELYFFHDRFTQPEANPIDYVTKNAERFMAIIESMNNRYTSGDYTTNSGLLRQIHTIDTTDLEGAIKNIGSAAEKGKTQKTIVVYVGSTAFDAVVDDDFSAQRFGLYAQEAGLDFRHFKAEGIIHSQYHRPEAIEAFNELFETISPEITQLITKDERAYATQRYGAYLIAKLQNNRY